MSKYNKYSGGPVQQVVENTLLEFKADFYGTPQNSIIVRDVLDEQCDCVPRIYSYIVRAIYKKGKFSHWNVKFMISQTDAYNQIYMADAAADILNTIMMHASEDETKVIIGYKQASLATLVEVYEPLVKKLALEQHAHWQDLEVDDLCQICRMVICTLYNGGYYVHKRIIQRAFYNEVLMIERKKMSQCPLDENGEPKAPTLVSTDDAKYTDSNGDTITYGESIEDPHRTDDALLEECDVKETEDLMGYYKDLVIDVMGARTYDAVLTEYKNGNPSKWAVTEVQKVKKKIGGI